MATTNIGPGISLIYLAWAKVGMDSPTIISIHDSEAGARAAVMNEMHGIGRAYQSYDTEDDPALPHQIDMNYNVPLGQFLRTTEGTLILAWVEVHNLYTSD